MSDEHTLALIRRAKTGDMQAKEQLVTENTSLLKSILRRYLGKGAEYDDLFQLAAMGLLKAIAGFDESFGVRFSTYAVPMIAGEIKRFLRDDGSVKVSRAMKKSAREMNRYIEEYAIAHGEQPSVRTLAEAFCMEEGDVVLTLGSQRMPVSIYEQTDYKDDRTATLAEKLPSGDDPDDMLERLILKDAIALLPERERKIVVLRYFRDMTQSEVAKAIGVSQVQISRIESKVMLELRRRLEERA